jgi:nucleotidyltransferase DUF2204
MMVARTGAQLPRCEFYRHVLDCLHAGGVRYLVGGAYALECFTGIGRETKDIDLFVAPAECDAALRLLERAGYATEMTSPVWLAKARCDDDFVDVIFSSGNGIAEVDEDWFRHAEEGEVLGVRVQLCPAEEMIWSRSWVMERERFDGADVVHLIRARGPRMDWHRLLARFGAHWRVLLAHLVLFGFVYPGERGAVPEWVMRELVQRLDRELAAPPSAQRLCLGTLLSRYQYQVDLGRWGYRDGRIRPNGRLTRQQAAALDREG